MKCILWMKWHKKYRLVNGYCLTMIFLNSLKKFNVSVVHRIDPRFRLRLTGTGVSGRAKGNTIWCRVLTRQEDGRLYSLFLDVTQNQTETVDRLIQELSSLSDRTKNETFFYYWSIKCRLRILWLSLQCQTFDYKPLCVTVDHQCKFYKPHFVRQLLWTNFILFFLTHRIRHVS